MNRRRIFPNLCEDIKRYIEGKITLKKIFYLIFSQEIWAIIVYRFGYWVHHYCQIPLIREILKIAAFFAFKLTELITGISIPFSVKIGRGLYIGHFGRIIINGRAEIGENCSIATGVVIGTRGLGDEGVPMIGNNVFIGVDAKILGNIKVGDGAKIGANAVVIKDVPENATVVGVPARVVKIKGKKV